MSPRGDEGTLTYRCPAALPGAEILLARQNRQNWRIFHERYSICTCDTAAAAWRYRGRSHVLDDRTYMLMEPGEAHFTYQVHKPSDFQVLFLSPAVVDRFTTEFALPGTAHLRIAQGHHPAFFRACQQLCAAVENGATVLEQQSRLAVCVRLLLTHHAERRPPLLSVVGMQPAIERVKRYLRERFEEAVTLDELCTVAGGVSRFHLLRAFSKHVGVPPHAYQLQVRIERARTLLQAGLRPASIASALGFADQSHFTRHFRRTLGITPARYARATARP